MVTIDELRLSDAPSAWEALGFQVDGDACRIGTVTLRLIGGGGAGIVGWSLRGAATAELDGLPTELSTETDPAAGPEAVEHPNGALQIDHVVVSSGDLDRTIAACEAAGIRLRRIREDRPRRMAFFRLGEVILELVEGEHPGPARFWGLVVVVRDLDSLAAQLGQRLCPIHDAVQPGRRIASLQDGAGIGPALAFMSSGE
ncbi:MAG: VOC family protein [Gaiellaceae bacterium]